MKEAVIIGRMVLLTNLLLEIIESSDLDTAEKEIEKHKVTEARKEVFGPTYKHFPPWK